MGGRELEREGGGDGEREGTNSSELLNTAGATVPGASGSVSSVSVFLFSQLSHPQAMRPPPGGPQRGSCRQSFIVVLVEP
eukprot:scaffold59540_cov17-Tisochrysis_lutea.AAC.1